MKKLHAKSPCCRGNIINFGGRRRQCILCKKTWRIRKKKTGRKKKRCCEDKLVKYLKNKTATLSSMSERKNSSRGKVQNETKRNLNSFLKNRCWEKIPSNCDLIIVADAMIKYINKEWYSFYLILIRDTKEDKAIILPPYIQKGRESCDGWYNAVDRIPKETKANIKALVCDGHRGLISVSIWEKWTLQRCHFHLLSSIRGRRSSSKWSKHGREGKIIYELVEKSLTVKDEKIALEYLSKVEEFGWHTKSNQLRKILSGFVNHYKDYRSYIYYPELNLPRTSNSAESLVNCIQDLCGRARGFRTIYSLLRWVNAFLKNKKFIKCSKFYQPS